METTEKIPDFIMLRLMKQQIEKLKAELDNERAIPSATRTAIFREKQIKERNDKINRLEKTIRELRQENEKLLCRNIALSEKIPATASQKDHKQRSHPEAIKDTTILKKLLKRALKSKINKTEN